MNYNEYNIFGVTDTDQDELEFDWIWGGDNLELLSELAAVHSKITYGRIVIRDSDRRNVKVFEAGKEFNPDEQ
jgi:hypothetical protein